MFTPVCMAPTSILSLCLVSLARNTNCPLEKKHARYSERVMIILCICAGERMYAHGGIVAAAAAILADMEQHNLLQRLLEEYDPFDQHHQQPSHRCD